jgi:DNA mismatch endonuclease (patch repair protein)
MTDTFDRAMRSKVMAAVKSKNNRTTEWRLRSALMRSGLSGWRMHAKDVLGCPDFVFDKKRLVVFVDGCFWHGCPKCYRAPQASKKYWADKVKRTMRRDKSYRAKLKRDGWRILRVWEHELRDVGKVVNKIRVALR